MLIPQDTIALRHKYLCIDAILFIWKPAIACHAKEVWCRKAWPDRQGKGWFKLSLKHLAQRSQYFIQWTVSSCTKVVSPFSNNNHSNNAIEQEFASSIVTKIIFKQ